MRFDTRAGIRLFTAIHEFWYRMTGGLIGGNFMGAPMLLLTTTGRKSGQRRTTPLLYLKDGDDVVVIASNGGSNRHPEWWLNLRAHPRAQVQVGDRRQEIRAEATRGEERARLWDQITRRYGVYRQYERRTSREIPVIRLTTAAAPSTNGAEPPRPARAATVKPKRRTKRRTTRSRKTKAPARARRGATPPES